MCDANQDRNSTDVKIRLNGIKDDTNYYKEPTHLSGILK